MNRPLVTVLDATGAEGGSGLVAALLADRHRPYAVRAVVPRSSPDAAPALAAAGCDAVAADPDDPALLQQAFAGSHGVFAATGYWAHLSPELERAQADVVAAAASAARVAHVVWSTPRPQAGAMRSFFRRDVPVTLLHTPFAWDNLIYLGIGPRPAADGALELVLPTGEQALAGIAVADVGTVAAALFARRTWMLGQSIAVAGELLTGAQMAAAIGRAIGEPVRHAPLATGEYAALGFPGAAELADLFASGHEAGDVAATRMLHPGVLGFDAWLDRHAKHLPVPAAARRA